MACIHSIPSYSILTYTRPIWKDRIESSRKYLDTPPFFIFFSSPVLPSSLVLLFLARFYHFGERAGFDELRTQYICLVFGGEGCASALCFFFSFSKRGEALSDSLAQQSWIPESGVYTDTRMDIWMDGWMAVQYITVQCIISKKRAKSHR